MFFAFLFRSFSVQVLINFDGFAFVNGQNIMAPEPAFELENGIKFKVLEPYGQAEFQTQIGNVAAETIVLKIPFSNFLL
jgi:hypothetical protein